MSQPVKYSKAGYWQPTIEGVVCQHCGVTFTAHKYNPKFCSKSCSAKTRMAKRFAGIKTKRDCPGCGKVWLGNPSDPSKYCSKQCIFDSGKWQKPKVVSCLNCGEKFKQQESTRKYCSKDCYSSHHPKSEVRVCAECGEEFEINAKLPSKTCSAECRDSYYIRDRSHNWTGGKVKQSERDYRRLDRDGYQAKYEGEHRIIAAREIGRQVERGEVVLCLDRNNDNYEPENLFLCPNQSEAGMIKAGTVEWPKSSNLKSFRENGYERPNVIIVLHEWENGKRRVGPHPNAVVTRHPQADEIIKRRKAGASIRILAEEFETVLSSMANIVKKRL